MNWVRFIRWVASFLPRRLITGQDNDPYLERFKVFGWVSGHSASRLDLREGLPEAAGFHVAGIILHRLGIE